MQICAPNRLVGTMVDSFLCPVFVELIAGDSLGHCVVQHDLFSASTLSPKCVPGNNTQQYGLN